ncbi:unnamed protein product, partial [Oppiella nova]
MFVFLVICGVFGTSLAANHTLCGQQVTKVNDDSSHYVVGGVNANPQECDGSCLGSYTSDSYLGVYEKYAISTDSEPCAPIGKAILEKGGNAIDSMISVLLCMGVTIPESMGLGGGALILIYNG